MCDTKNSEDSPTFDDVLESIGSNGRYQKMYLVYLFCMTMCGCFFYFNYIIALTTPEHWCNVPGRNLTNFTLEEWKSIHIPKVRDESNQEVFSSCQMYNFSKSSNKSEIIDCQFGWSYDFTWYTRTIISDEDWVCDKNFYATNIVAFCKVSEIFGSITASYLGDIYGRKFVIVWTLVLIIIGRVVMLFTTAYYYAFLISTLIASFGSISTMLSATIIAMEITGEDHRSQINMIQANGWAFGLGFTPLLMWAVGDWFYFVILTTIPCAIYLILTRYIVESPRWILSQGNMSDCVQALNTIAKVNKTQLPEDITLTLTQISKQKSVNYGILSFFSHWRITKNTICINVCWIVTGLSYMVLILNSGNVGSNPIIAGFFQGIIEIPANIVGMAASNYFGRRLTHMSSHIGTVIGCIPLIFLQHRHSTDVISTILTIFLKFAVAMTLYCLYLHTMEIYPTCLRQSGMSFGSLNSNVISILAPYVVYATVNIDSKLPYYIFLVMAIAAASSVFFLPETLHVVLPETLEDAKKFGKHQKLLNFSVKKTEFEPVQVLEKNILL